MSVLPPQLKQFDVGDVEGLVGRYSHVEHGIKLDGRAHLSQFYGEKSLQRRLAATRWSSGRSRAGEKLCKLWRALLSLSRASRYVRLALPVSAQLHTRLLHRMVLSKNSLREREKNDRADSYFSTMLTLGVG